MVTQTLSPCKAWTRGVSIFLGLVVQNPGLGPSLSDLLGAPHPHPGAPTCYPGGLPWLSMPCLQPPPWLCPWAICFISSCLVSPSLGGLC